MHVAGMGFAATESSDRDKDARERTLKLKNIIAFALVIGVASCAGPFQSENLTKIGSSCTEDSDCPNGLVCFYDWCEDSSFVSFDHVELEVHPPAWTEKPPQVFQSINAVDKLLLRDLAPIRIQLIGDSGQNLSYRVVASQQLDGSSRQIQTASWTDDEGVALLQLLPSAVYHLALLPEDNQMAPYFADSLRVTEQVVSQGHQIQLPQREQMYRVRGRVVAGPQQAPQGVADMRVEILGWEGHPRKQRVVSSTSVTDQTNPGSFELWLPSNVGSLLQLRVSATVDNPNVPTMVVDAIDVPADVDLGDLSLGEFGVPTTVTGSVTHQAAPVAGARVTFSGTVAQGRFSQTTFTEADGSYSISLLPGSYQAMVVPAVESRAATQVQQVEVVGPQAVDFAPLSRVIYDCQVLQHGDRGGPASLVGVEATREGNVANSIAIDHFVHTTHVTQTDQQGRFRLFLDPGVYSFAYIPDSHDGLHARTVEYLNITGDENRETTLDFSKRMLGEVRYQNHAFVPNAKVRAYINLQDRSPLIGETWTDRMGNFSISLPAQILD